MALRFQSPIARLGLLALARQVLARLRNTCGSEGYSLLFYLRHTVWTAGFSHGRCPLSRPNRSFKRTSSHPRSESDRPPPALAPGAERRCFLRCRCRQSMLRQERSNGGISLQVLFVRKAAVFSVRDGNEFVSHSCFRQRRVQPLFLRVRNH